MFIPEDAVIPAMHSSKHSQNQQIIKDRVGIPLKIGQKVFVDGSKHGILRTLGSVAFSEGVWCGVELYNREGKNDGTVQGMQYFCCEPMHGVFVRPHRLTHAPSPNYLDRNTAMVAPKVCGDCNTPVPSGSRKVHTKCVACNRNLNTTASVQKSSLKNSMDVTETKDKNSRLSNQQQYSSVVTSSPASSASLHNSKASPVPEHRRGTYVVMMENANHNIPVGNRNASKIESENGKSANVTAGKNSDDLFSQGKRSSSLPNTPVVQRRYEQPTFSSTRAKTAKADISHVRPAPFAYQNPSKLVNEYEVSNLLRANEDLEEEKKQLIKTITENKTNLKKFMKDYSSVYMSEGELKNVIIDLQEKILMRDHKIEAAMDAKHELEEKIVSLQEKLLNDEDSKEEIQLLSGMLKRTKEELVKAKEEIKSGQEQVKQTSADARVMSAEVKKNSEELKERNAELKLAVAKLETNLAEKNIQLENAMASIQKKDKSISKLCLDTSAMQSANVELSDSVRAAKRDVDHQACLLQKTEFQLMQKESTIQKQMKDIYVLKDQLDEQSKEMSNVKKNNVDLATKCRTTFVEVESLLESVGIGVIKGKSNSGELSPWTSIKSTKNTLSNAKISEEVEDKINAMKAKHQKELSQIQKETELAVEKAEERSKKSYQDSLERELDLEQQIQQFSDKLIEKDREIHQLFADLDAKDSTIASLKIQFSEQHTVAQKARDLERVLAAEKEIFEGQLKSEKKLEKDLEEKCRLLERDAEEKDDMIKVLGVEIARLSSALADSGRAKENSQTASKHEHLIQEIELREERLKMIEMENHSLKSQLLQSQEASSKNSYKEIRSDLDDSLWKAQMDQKNELIADLKKELLLSQTRKQASETGAYEGSNSQSLKIEELLRELNAKENVIRSISESIKERKASFELTANTEAVDGESLQALCKELQEELQFREAVMKRIEGKLDDIEKSGGGCDLNSSHGSGLGSYDIQHAMVNMADTSMIKEKEAKIQKLETEVAQLQQTIAHISLNPHADESQLQRELNQSKDTILRLKDKLAKSEEKYEKDYKQKLYGELQNLQALPDEIQGLRNMIDMKNYLISQLRAEIDMLTPQAKRASALEYEVQLQQQKIQQLQTIVESQALVQKLS